MGLEQDTAGRAEAWRSNLGERRRGPASLGVGGVARIIVP